MLQKTQKLSCAFKDDKWKHINSTYITKKLLCKNVLNHIVIQVLVLPLSYILYCDSVADREIKSQIVTPARSIEEE